MQRHKNLLLFVSLWLLLFLMGTSIVGLVGAQDAGTAVPAVTPEPTPFLTPAAGIDENNS